MRFMIFAAAVGGALLAALPALAAVYTAGERHAVVTTSSAAVRNHGDAKVRITLWYPSAAPDKEFDLGPPDHPAFIAGRVAEDAPFADDARRPLILVSHGFGGAALQMAWLGTALARAGYVVVAVDHPGTNGRDGVTAEGAAAPWERARDLQAALDRALADPGLAAHIDASRIGVAGFSLGGFTALLELGARADFDQLRAFCAGPQRDAICEPQLEYPTDLTKLSAVLAEPDMAPLAAEQKADLSDPRVKAAFLIAPAGMEGMDFASLRAIRRPVAIALGAADPVAPPKTNGELAGELVPGATVDLLPGVGHYDFLSECGAAGLANLKPLCTDVGGAPRHATHEHVAAEAVAFFDRTLR